MNEEINKANSHKNELNIKRIILIAESEIVKINKAKGNPNAKKAQPKNSATVMVSSYHSVCLKNLSDEPIH